jgi:hypothetical protein
MPCELELALEAVPFELREGGGLKKEILFHGIFIRANRNRFSSCALRWRTEWYDVDVARDYGVDARWNAAAFPRTLSGKTLRILSGETLTEFFFRSRGP